MAYTPVLLYQGNPGTTTTLLYTASGGVIVKQILMSNTSSASATITIALGVAGAALGSTNTIVPTVSIPGNSVITLDVTLVMANTDVLRGLQGTSGAIVASIHGLTF